MLICQVQGILMERDSVDAQQSFSSLGGSQRMNTRLFVLARAARPHRARYQPKWSDSGQRRPLTLVAGKRLVRALLCAG
jgi:hypothetical protein